MKRYKPGKYVKGSGRLVKKPLTPLGEKIDYLVRSQYPSLKIEAFCALVKCSLRTYAYLLRGDNAPKIHVDLIKHIEDFFSVKLKDFVIPRWPDKEKPGNVAQKIIYLRRKYKTEWGPGSFAALTGIDLKELYLTEREIIPPSKDIVKKIERVFNIKINNFKIGSKATEDKKIQYTENIGKMEANHLFKYKQVLDRVALPPGHRISWGALWKNEPIPQWVDR